MGIKPAYSLYNTTKEVVLAEKLLVAGYFWQRMAGLLAKKELSGREGLLLIPCNAVHTMFMRYSIDVLFLNRELVVVKALGNLRPWRFACGGRVAFQTLELKAGIIAATGTVAGDRLAIVKGPGV
ncbi:MAG TPA: DUF192 domain-containing protein [Desulfotomaculum sp.]|jgi:uncharacterized membrane protein (UPF0127 family)|nr:DUF192 domain-containing protein [Desulfotomaculum sp.]